MSVWLKTFHTLLSLHTKPSKAAGSNLEADETNFGKIDAADSSHS